MASTSRPNGHCGLSSPEVRDRLTLEFRHHLECTDLAGASIRLFEGAAVLRHSCAMNTYKATKGDVRKVSIMLGHLGLKSTEMYVRTDTLERLEVLETRTAPQIRKGRFDDAPDRLVTMLKDVARV